MFGDNEHNPCELNIDCWKALNTLDSSTVGLSRNEFNIFLSIWGACGAKM